MVIHLDFACIFPVITGVAQITAIIERKMRSVIEPVCSRLADLSRRVVNLALEAMSARSHPAMSTAAGAPVRYSHPMPAGAQWQAIANVLGGRIKAARLIAERQRNALTQLDAAEFTLANIIEELSAIMPLAPRRAFDVRQAATGAPKALAA